MASAVHAVSVERHAHKAWRPLSHYSHAQGRALVGIVPSEIAQAVQAFPLAFVVQNGAVNLVAMLGVAANSNLFVASDGKWLGSYVPALLRAHPFSIAEANNSQILCIDEAVGLAGDDEDNARPFFDAAGQLAKPTADVVQFIQTLTAQLAQSSQMAGLLLEHKVLEPWPIEVRGTQVESKLEGLLRINEKALGALSDDAFLGLRRGALALAHAQLLSMANIAMLPRIAEARGAHERVLVQRRQEQAAMFQASGAHQDSIDWTTIFNE